jgi:hypothetical protein
MAWLLWARVAVLVLFAGLAGALVWMERSQGGKR